MGFWQPEEAFGREFFASYARIHARYSKALKSLFPWSILGSSKGKQEERMKLKVMLSSDDPIMEELRKLNIEIDDRSEYVLTRREMDLNYLPAKNGEQTFYISIDDIIFIESLGHDVMLHTKDGVYVTKERLKTLERMLDPDDFLRVSNSSIVSIKNIRRIEASILQKFILHMSNGDKVDVTRSYYYIFKDRFNI